MLATPFAKVTVNDYVLSLKFHDLLTKHQDEQY